MSNNIDKGTVSQDGLTQNKARLGLEAANRSWWKLDNPEVSQVAVGRPPADVAEVIV